MRILLVEDEIGIAEPLCKLLEKNNLPTDVVYDGLSGFIQAKKNIYDVIILDIMLPEMNGLEVLKKIRDLGLHTPVLLLTAKDSVDDKVRGLELGADDYLTKPFSAKELIARVRALSRRRPEIVESNKISFGDITLNPNNATLSVGNDVQGLTAKEVHILDILIRNANNVVSKEHLLDTVWGFESDAIDNTVEIYIHYLRKKLQNSKSVRIKTKRGLGYSLVEE
ncbi:MAG: response regulator transcription factor [Eubacteriaceae bacterium]|nr:response regulator transcription factor [Eubacteriaceae bacterium]